MCESANPFHSPVLHSFELTAYKFILKQYRLAQICHSNTLSISEDETTEIPLSCMIEQPLKFDRLPLFIFLDVEMR
jgi:hypothetical protein